MSKGARADAAADLVYIKDATRRLDDGEYDGAFAALGPAMSFHAETYRGKIRLLQLRLEEAVDHFVEAERLYAAVKQRPYEDVRRYIYLKSCVVDLCLLNEVLDPFASEEAVLDAAVRALLTVGAEDLYLLKMTNYKIATHALLRGDLERALRIFEELLNNERREDESPRRMNLYLKGAACHREFGRRTLAREYLRRAEGVIVECDHDARRMARFCSLAYAVLTFWEEPTADDWLDALDELPADPEVIAAHREVARAMASASRAKGRPFLI